MSENVEVLHAAKGKKHRPRTPEEKKAQRARVVLRQLLRARFTPERIADDVEQTREELKPKRINILANSRP